MLITKEQRISRDGTVKFLFELTDGNLIETVLMRHDYGNSVCVSSQVGCSMGCVFCASGLLKKVRDLTAEEMLEQVFSVQETVTHVVVMGTGEPFDNYDEVLRFCDMVSNEKLLKAYRKQTGAPVLADQQLRTEADTAQLSAIAPRHITVSTCGLVPKIQDFAQTAKRYNLAISLHAPDDAIRSRLMPVNNRYPVAEVIRAAKEYCEISGRRVTFEYLLLKGINDSAECAQKLAALLQSGGHPEAVGEMGISDPIPETIDETAGSYHKSESPACNRKRRGNKDFYVNLIPWNDIGDLSEIQIPQEHASETAGFSDNASIPCLAGAGREDALAFYDILMKNGIKATLRKERGTDIAAACGQLRAQALHKHRVV